MQTSAVNQPQSPEAAVLAADSRELALLRLAAAGDRRAFETLYCDYHPRLTRFVQRLTQRQELIEEAINDAFWVVWRKAGDFRGNSLVSTWIIGITYRCTLKALRGSGQGASSEPLATDYIDELLEETRRSDESREWINHGLRQLPLEQRATIQLAYYLGHSCEEIAEIMECSVGTVKARMFRARVRLRNLLPALGGSD